MRWTPPVLWLILFLLYLYKVLMLQMLSLDCKRYGEVAAFCCQFFIDFLLLLTFWEELGGQLSVHSYH